MDNPTDSTPPPPPDAHPPVAHPSGAHPPVCGAPSWRGRAQVFCRRWRYPLAGAAVAAVFALSSIPFHQPPRVYGLDKPLHLVEYMLLELAFLNIATGGFQRARARAVILAWGAMLLVSLLDEGYQYWIPGRTPDRWDLVFSALGGSLAVAVVSAWGLIHNARPNP